MTKLPVGAGHDEKSKWPATRWNPSGLTTNCGFCAISYALEQQKGKLIDADELYLRTLHRLDIDPDGDEAPPRMLIFPKLGLDETEFRGEYKKMEGRGRSPADYSLWSVAHDAGLDLKSGDKILLNSLVEFAAAVGPKWALDDFIRARMNLVKGPFASVKAHVQTSLSGNSIIGSIGAAHFVNLVFRPSGEFTVFDAQKGIPYDGRRIKVELGKLDLFERVTTG